MFESWQIQTSEGRGQGGKMPSPPQKLTTQEAAFAHRGGANSGVGGPIEGVLRISARKIFDQ